MPKVYQYTDNKLNIVQIILQLLFLRDTLYNCNIISENMYTYNIHYDKNCIGPQY
jgi:hypothetical protein